jgi:microcystin-dependent protein
MANTIKIKNSGNTSAVPSTLEHGELGLNYADGKIFYKNNSNVIVEFSGAGGGGTEMPTGSLTQFAGSTAPAGWLSCDGANVSRTTYAALFAIIGTTYGAGDGSTTFGLPNMKGRIPVGFDSAQTEFDALGETGGAKTHALTSAEMPSHTHTQNAHNHTQNAHNHTQNAHGHSTDAQGFHAHNVGITGSGTSSTSHRHEGTSTFARGINGGTLLGYNFVTDGQGSHGHNITAATPTNNAATATNNATTATNQNTGGNGAHNNLQPYIVLNYIIKI